VASANFYFLCAKKLVPFVFEKFSRPQQLVESIKWSLILSLNYRRIKCRLPIHYTIAECKDMADFVMVVGIAKCKNMRKVGRFAIRSEGNKKPGNRTRQDIPPYLAEMVLVFSHRGSIFL